MVINDDKNFNTSSPTGMYSVNNVVISNPKSDSNRFDKGPANTIFMECLLFSV